MMNIKTLILMVVVAIMAVSCARLFSRNAGKLQAGGSWANLDAEEFQTLIADPAVQLLDVRTRDEYDEGHIAAAVLVDVNDAAFVQNAMAVLDKQRPVALYCRSGRRSARAAGLLVEQGFEVSNLNGGVIAWQDAGKALLK